MIEIVISFGPLIISSVALIVSTYVALFKLKADVIPVLVFTYKNKYELENFGNGPALDVIVFNSERGSSNFVKAVSCYPISKGSSNDLVWLGSTGRLGVTYKDIYGHGWTSFCQDDQVEIKSKKLIDCNQLGLSKEREREIRARIQERHKNMAY